MKSTSKQHGDNSKTPFHLQSTQLNLMLQHILKHPAIKAVKTSLGTESLRSPLAKDGKSWVASELRSHHPERASWIIVLGLLSVS